MRSRSVLADVFKSTRQPATPPTPQAWISGVEEAPKAPPPVRNSQPDEPEQPGNRFGGNKGQQQPRRAAGHSAASRKADAKSGPLASKNPGNTAAWGEITKSRHKGAVTHRHDHSQLGKETQTTEPAKEDFWGELDGWTTTLKEQRAENIQDEATPKRLRGKGKPSSDFDEYEGRHEPQDKSKKNKKKGKRNDRDDDWEDEQLYRHEQKQRQKAAREAAKQAEAESAATPIFLPEFISAANLAQSLKQGVEQFMYDMEEMGFENVTSDTIMTGETAALIAMEYGFDPTVDTGTERDLRPAPAAEDPSTLPSRPPVVTIMGHVDHGKTTLLDFLRKSSVAAQEHGGITQHIGAFVVKMQSGKLMTFLDTPGHAAFLSMRQRGANVTDIVILVVAADDSVKPQTLEALKHAQAAKVPIIVAINKIDKEDARVDQVKADLSRHGVEIEDYGGDVQVVCVSGKTGQGMADLEENIVTLSEVLDVRAEREGLAEGWILESSVKQFGKTATVLVKRGTLRTGDVVVAGKTWARVRLLLNEAGVEVDEAPPGTPVEVYGWRDVLPDAGEMMLQASDEGRAKTAIDYRLEMVEREQSSAQLAEQEQRLRDKAAAEAEESGEGAEESEEGGIKFQNFTVKCDVAGSVEAVCATVQELGNAEVGTKILRSSAGQITEYDIDHAAISNCIIINFNSPIPPQVKRRAEDAGVKILDHTVIYHVVDDVKAALSELLPFNITQRVLGEADILQTFAINLRKREYKTIAGCKVRNGSIKRSSRIRVLRKGEIIYDGKIDTLKHVKKDVLEMGKGTECGIGLEDFQDLQVDDQLQTYEEHKERRYM